MAYFQFDGADDEHPDLAKAKLEVAQDTDNYENWEKLVRIAESLEGGVNRNSSPQAIQAVRDIFDRFLAKFPLFFGWWKKYADMEFAVGGTESAELIYERAVASITNSVDLWTHYCTFKVDTSHDNDIIRELFERAAECVGLDFLSHLFWDKYIEFEDRLEDQDRVFEILSRVVLIPMHQYARYFERYRSLALQRSTSEQCPPDRLAQFKAEVTMEAGSNSKTESEIEYALRQKMEQYHMEVFQRTQDETTKRWPFEQGIKRPFFHVNDFEDDQQVPNWRNYLDFEESNGDPKRITFLYERCLVACAYYVEFWFRYIRWMASRPKREQDVRNIYQRASCLYAPIAQPTIRLQWALFEETEGRVAVAQDIYRAMLDTLPGHVETIVGLANCIRRHEGIDAAINVYQEHIDSGSMGDATSRATLIREWARLLAKVKGNTEEARQVYQNHQQAFLDNREFWTNYLTFEIDQPGDAENDPQQYARVKQVFDDIRRNMHIPGEMIRDMAQPYMAYLLERGGDGVAKEYLEIDRDMNGCNEVNRIRLPWHYFPEDAYMPQVGSPAAEMQDVSDAIGLTHSPVPGPDDVKPSCDYHFKPINDAGGLDSDDAMLDSADIILNNVNVFSANNEAVEASQSVEHYNATDKI